MKKDISAILVLDEKTNVELNEVKEVLSYFGISHNLVYGHITLAHFINADVDEILKYTKKFASGKKAFEVNCSALGLLTTNGIVCFPSISVELFKFYEEYHQKYDGFCNKWTSFEGGLWLPHISLYRSDTHDLAPIICELSKKFTEFKGRVAKLELSVVNEDGFDIIYSYNLE